MNTLPIVENVIAVMDVVVLRASGNAKVVLLVKDIDIGVGLGKYDKEVAFKVSPSIAVDKNNEGESSNKLEEKVSIRLLLEGSKGMLISVTLATIATESKFPSVGIMMDVDL